MDGSQKAWRSTDERAVLRVDLGKKTDQVLLVEADLSGRCRRPIPQQQYRRREVQTEGRVQPIAISELDADAAHVGGKLVGKTPAERRPIPTLNIVLNRTCRPFVSEKSAEDLSIGQMARGRPGVIRLLSDIAPDNGRASALVLDLHS